MSADLVIVVPGITGSVLARGDGRELWSLSAAALRQGLLHTGEVLEQLSLPVAAADVSEFVLKSPEVIRGVHVWPGFWRGPGYAKLIDTLTAAVSGRVLSFAYDWRMPNAYTASRLREFVDDAMARFPGSRVSLVCHSMGGLIARYYLEVLGGRAHVTRLVTVGTPFSGSVKAVKALTGQSHPRFPEWSARLARVAASFPSVAELLPTYRCVDAGPGREPLTLTEVVDIPGLPGDLVLRGRGFHDELRAKIEANRAADGAAGCPYAVHVFAGKSHDTDQSVVLDRDKVVFQRTQRGIDHAGDGTVAHFAAVPAEWDSTASALFRAAKHGPLTSHKYLLEDVVAAVTARPLRGILAPVDDLSLHVPELVTAQEPVELCVTSPTANLRLHATITDVDDVPLVEHLPVLPDDSGHRYTRSVELPPGVWQLRIDEITKTPAAFVEDLITVM